MNMAAQLAQATRRFSNSTALSEPDQAITFAELERRSEAVAAHLVESGLRPGDRVAAFLPNSIDSVVLLYAVLRTGGVFAPLNYRFSDRDLQFVLEDSGSTFLAAQAGDLGRLMPLVPNTSVRQLVVRSGEAPAQSGGVEIRRLDDIYRAGPSRRMPVAARRDEDDALLMYTSGTTGRPKGVRQTHRNNTASVEMVVAAWQLEAKDRLLQALPLFHVGGLQCTTLPALVVGAQTHFLARWDADAWLQAMETLQPTFSGLVTTMLIDVVGRVEAKGREASRSSLRFCVFGGSATPSHIADRFEKLLEVPLVELYGQTETTGLITTYDTGEARVPGSMGRVRTEVADAIVLTAEGEEMAFVPGAEGEIAFAGETVTPGYWRRQEETERRRHGRFLRTGDVVRVDNQGYVRYIDRVDNMIVTGGENVYPAPIEAVIARHPKVAQVAVIGTPHERLVHQVTAIVVPSDPTLTADEILSFAAGSAEIAPYMRPRRVEMVEDLPKTGSGKVDRARLRLDFAN